jgi:hypothetical protein
VASGKKPTDDEKNSSEIGLLYSDYWRIYLPAGKLDSDQEKLFSIELLSNQQVR